MAMKIEFSANFKDSEQTLKILQELSKEIEGISKRSGSAGAEGRRAFEEIGQSIKQFETTSKSVDSIKKLNEQLKLLSSTKGDLASFAKSFTDLGSAMNKGLGFAAESVTSQFKQALDSLRKEADTTADKLKEALKSVNDPNATPEQKESARSKAAAYAVEAKNYEQNIKSLERQNMLDTPRAYLGGASIGSAMGMATQVASGLGFAGKAYEEAVYISRSGIRGDIAQRQLLRSQAIAAGQGDITSSLLTQAGVGEEANYGGFERGYDKYGKNVTAGFLGIMGGVGAGAAAGLMGLNPLTVIGGGIAGGYAAWKAAGGYASPEEREAQKRGELRELDRAKYQGVFDRGHQIQKSLYQADKQLFLTQGDDNVMSTVEALAKGGINVDRAAPTMSLLNKYGINLGGHYSWKQKEISRMETDDEVFSRGGKLRSRQQITSKAVDPRTGLPIMIRDEAHTEDGRDRLYRAKQDLGLSDDTMEELVRHGRGTGASVDALNYAMGSSGFKNRIAMAGLGDVYSQISGLNAGGFAEMGNVYGRVNAITQSMATNTGGKISDMEMLQATSKATGRVQDIMSDPRSQWRSIATNKMVKLGINDPVMRETLAQQYAAGNYSEVESIMGDLGIKDGRKVFDEAGQEFEKNTRFLGGSKQTQEILAKHKLDARGMGMFGTLKDMQTWTGEALSSVFKGDVGDTKSKAAGDLMKRGEMLKADEGEAKTRTAAELKGTRDVAEILGKSISQVIIDGFENMAKELKGKVRDISKDKAQVNSEPRGFFGMISDVRESMNPDIK